MTTQANPTDAVAPNRLARQFTVERPDTVWLTDITYIETEAGFLYLAAVLDLAMADHLRAELVEGALDMALIQRRPGDELLHHSDQGSQYTSQSYQQRLRARGVTVSMSVRLDSVWTMPRWKVSGQR